MNLTTESAVQALTLPVGVSDKIFFDSELTGFGVRVRASGLRKWIVQYSLGQGHRQQRRITLGSIAVLTPVAARAEAKKLLAAVCLGRDPSVEKREASQESMELRIARKALSFLDKNIEPACYLYRHYHPNGDLLYVGISLEPLRRQDRHTKMASWRNMIYRIVIEPFVTRDEALAAEQIAIRNEFPKFNITHNSKRHPLQELMRR